MVYQRPAKLEGPSPRGVPKKGVNKEYNDFSSNLSVKNLVLKLRFVAFPEGTGGFRELRGAGRNHFHLSWCLIVPGITSYGQKPWGQLIIVYGIQNTRAYGNNYDNIRNQ